MSCISRNEEGMSLSQIRQRIEDGFSVIRTAHIGNTSLSNMVLAQVGVPYHCFVFNQISRDDIYRPEFLIKNDSSEQIGSMKPVLVGFGKSVNGGHIPAHTHFLSLSKLMGNNFYLEVEFLLKHSDLVAKFFKMVPSDLLFNREAKDGVVSDKIQEVSAEVFLDALAGYRKAIFTGDEVHLPSTIPMLNITALVALTSYIQSEISGRNMVFEVSGLAMMSYTAKPKFENPYNEIMELIFEKGLTRSCVNLTLLPSKSFNFACIPQYAEELDDMLDACLNVLEIQNSIRNLRAENQNLSKKQFKRLSSPLRIESRPHKHRIAELMYILPSSYNKKGYYYTQYDLLDQGGVLYVPERYQKLSYDVVDRIDKLLSSKRIELEKEASLLLA